MITLNEAINMKYEVKVELLNEVETITLPKGNKDLEKYRYATIISNPTALKAENILELNKMILDAKEEMLIEEFETLDANYKKFIIESGIFNLSTMKKIFRRNTVNRQLIAKYEVRPLVKDELAEMVLNEELAC